jgi:hypothetical protein
VQSALQRAYLRLFHSNQRYFEEALDIIKTCCGVIVVVHEVVMVIACRGAFRVDAVQRQARRSADICGDLDGAVRGGVAGELHSSDAGDAFGSGGGAAGGLRAVRAWLLNQLRANWRWCVGDLTRNSGRCIRRWQV